MRAKKTALLILTSIVLSLAPESLIAQSDSTGTFWKPTPRNYEVKQAFEIESLFPMFFFGGYHIGIGYRYNKFRFRVSVINGGTYNADVQAVGDIDEGYKRYYTTSPGVFLGYNVWKNLEVYGYYERHTFEVEQMSTGYKQDIPSNDFGIGISYQLFIGRTFYIQPGIHSYFRTDQTITFPNSGIYSIPTFELSPIVRIGARLWKKY
ncbi:MAG: hypothetical protein WCX31_04055 [Salinivirgaceae bacterium]|jgi:hypothetical protein